MKNIDDFFKEELGSYAELPPPPAWGALEKRLDEEKKRRAFPYRWLWFVSVIALMGITGLSVAWKMSASRELLAGSVVPTEHKFPAVVNPGNTKTTANTPEQVIGANESTSVKTTRSPKTGKHAIAATTHKKQSVRHLALASSHAPKMSRQKKAVLSHISEAKESKLAAKEAEKAQSQYPDEDYYENATASIAPTPAELSAPTGYTINKRKKNNMLVADMTPKDEPAISSYAAVPTTTMPDYSEPVARPAKAAATHKAARTARSIAHHSKPATKTASIAKKPAPQAETAVAATTPAKTTKHTITTTKPAQSASIAAAAKVQKPATATSTLAATKIAKPAIEHKTASTSVVAATPKTIIATPATEARKVAATETKPATPQTVAAKAPVAKMQEASHPLLASASKAAATPKATKVPATEPKLAVAKVTSTQSISAASAPAKKQAKQDAKAIAKAETKKTSTPTVAASTTTADQKPVEQAMTAKEITAPVAAKSIAKTETPAKIAKAPIAMASPRVKPGKAAMEPAKAEPATMALNAATTKTKHSKKAAATVSGNETAATTIAAIAGSQPARKVAKTTPKTTAVTTAKPTPATESGIAAAEEHSKPAAKAVKAPATKEQPKTAGKAGKPAVNNFASAAKAAKTPASSKTSSPAKAHAGNLSPMTEAEMPTEDPTASTSTTSSTLAAGDQPATIPGTFKEKAATNNPLPVAQKEEGKPQADSTPVAAAHKRFDFGIKGGFEGSMNGDASRKLIISPYLDYRISNKFSLLIQPAFKASNLQKHDLSGTQTFYHVTGGDSTMTSSTPILIVNPNGSLDTMYNVSTYRYKQTHDSVSKSYSVGGNYFEIELPLLLKYAITPKLSVYAGVNVNYSRAMRVNEHTFTSNPIVRVDSNVTTLTPKGQPQAPAPTVASVFANPAGLPLSSYAGPLYPTSSEGIFRLGYMLGFSYEFKKRWLFDALVQQGSAKSNVMGGFDVNKPLTLPYVRLTLGYRLSK